MPLRDTSRYNLKIEGEPKEVEEIRKKIVESFDELEFVDEGHKYFLHGEELTSVSNITHLFSPEFNDEEQAIKYAEKHGETPQYWLDKWKYTSLKATTTGTLVHAFAESYSWLRCGHPELITEECKCKYDKEHNWLIPTRDKEESVLNFFAQLDPTLHMVMAETKLYSGVNPDLPKFNQNYAGTFDLLMYYKHPTDDSKSGLVILDYKTNSDLYKDYSRQHNKMLFYPFNDMYDEALSNYTIQLSLYQIPLEDIGLKIIARRVVWLKPDGEFEMIKIPDVTDKLRLYFTSKNNKKIKNKK
jgi:hypothetical protein